MLWLKFSYESVFLLTSSKFTVIIMVINGGVSMNKIQVNHTPDFMKGVAIFFAFLWVIFIFIVCGIIPKFAMLLSLGFLLLIIGISCYIDSRKTTVEYDTEKIHWKWLWFEYTINFEDMKSFYYTIVSERTRGGYIRRFELIFWLKDGELKLNDELRTEDIESAINGITDDIELLQLYKFIENIYPKKAEGFIKTSETY